MAKFKAKMPDLVVSTDNGFISFINGLYSTTNKAEIEALKKARDVTEIKGATRAKATPTVAKVIENV